jgi:hypothetical protein
MAVYHVALVQFDGGTKTYPVNGHECHQEGQRVIVEMAWASKSLEKAVVVGRSFSKKPCRHSIVCREENANDYGAGPSAVTTKTELDRFMRHMSLRSVPAFSCNPSGIEIKEQDWSFAYLPEYLYPFLNDDNLPFSAHVDVYLIGLKGIGICYADDEDVRLRRVGQRLGVVRTSRLIVRLLPKNVFQGIASLALGDLAHEKMPERTDRSMSEIRGAIGGGGDSPHYLGDDVWV